MFLVSRRAGMTPSTMGLVGKIPSLSKLQRPTTRLAHANPMLINPPLEKRRLEKEYALHGGAPPASDAECDGEDEEQDDESEVNPSVSGTTTYENGDVMVTVTTSEITPEEFEHPREKSAASVPPPLPTSGGSGKKHNIPVSKVKPFKKSTKGRSRPKLHSKRDRRKGKNNSKRRH